MVVHLTELYKKGFHRFKYDFLIGQGANSVKIIRIQST